MCRLLGLCFAYLNVITTGLLTLGCAGLAMKTFVDVIYETNDIVLYSGPKNVDLGELMSLVIKLAICFVSLIIGIISMTAFLFSAALYMGIKEEKAELMKAYCLFGLGLTKFVVFSTICFMVRNGFTPGCYILIGCAVYALCLGMIRLMYKNMK